MTELEEAELTDGQGRALSAHKSRAYEGCAKRTMERALAATRNRHAHRLTNATGTDVQNDPQNRVQNDSETNTSKPNKRKSFKGMPWLGRQDSNLGMAEIKIRRIALKSIPFFAKQPLSGPLYVHQWVTRTPQNRSPCFVGIKPSHRPP
jgi:hypothetical protein